jgi:hypothetical protein
LFLPPPFLPPFPSESLSPSPFPSTFQDDIPSGRELCVMWLQLQSPVCGSQAPSHCAHLKMLCVVLLSFPLLHLSYLYFSFWTQGWLWTLVPKAPHIHHSILGFFLLPIVHSEINSVITWSSG